MSIDETEAVAATCEQISGHIDMKVRRMAPLSGELAARFDALVAQQNALGWDAPLCGAMKP
jgi:acyl-CoA thioester hydrolase